LIWLTVSQVANSNDVLAAMAMKQCLRHIEELGSSQLSIYWVKDTADG
jgi:hypothetical protein